MLDAELDRCLHGFLPGTMAKTARTMALPGPASVAVHDDRNMAGQGGCGSFHIVCRGGWVRVGQRKFPGLCEGGLRSFQGRQVAATKRLKSPVLLISLRAPTLTPNPLPEGEG